MREPVVCLTCLFFWFAFLTCAFSFSPSNKPETIIKTHATGRACCAHPRSPLYMMRSRPTKLTLCVHLSSPACCFPASRSSRSTPSAPEEPTTTAAPASAAADFWVSGVIGEVSALEVLPVSISSKVFFPMSSKVSSSPSSSSSVPGVTFAEGLSTPNTELFLTALSTRQERLRRSSQLSVSLLLLLLQSEPAGVLFAVVVVIDVPVTSLPEVIEALPELCKDDGDRRAFAGA